MTDAAGAQRSHVTLDNAAARYRIAKTALAAIASGTAFAVITGSASKTVRIKRIAITCAATAAGGLPVTLVKGSDAGTLGSAALTQLNTTTLGKLDSSSASSTANVSTVGTAVYTTLPTSAGVLGAMRMPASALTTAATSGEAKPAAWDFSGGALVLRGVLECVYVTTNAATALSGGVYDFECEWEEDAS
jgi:hypothetical protein